MRRRQGHGSFWKTEGVWKSPYEQKQHSWEVAISLRRWLWGKPGRADLRHRAFPTCPSSPCSMHGLKPQSLGTWESLGIWHKWLTWRESIRITSEIFPIYHLLWLSFRKKDRKWWRYSLQSPPVESLRIRFWLISTFIEYQKKTKILTKNQLLFIPNEFINSSLCIRNYSR